MPSIYDAAGFLLSQTPGDAYALGLAYRESMVRQGYSPNTVNRKLATLRSLVKEASKWGMVVWSMRVENLKTQPYRDTRGPGRSAYVEMLKTLSGRTDAKGQRDLAILILMHDQALRRSEVAGLDVADVDLAGRRVWVLGKGKTQKIGLTISTATSNALKEWFEIRGKEPGPLFTNMDRAGKGKALTGRSVHRIIQQLGSVVRVRTWPHGLRHTAITEALESHDIRAVRKFSRHAKLDTVLIYDDQRQDVAGQIAESISFRVPNSENNGKDPEVRAEN